MFFTRLEEAINSTTNASRASLESRIEELERELVQLRNEHSANEERHQNQKTLKGALESGLVQIIYGQISSYSRTVESDRLSDRLESRIRLKARPIRF